MYRKTGGRSLYITSVLIFVTSLILPQSSVRAAATMTVEPITWNVIGLDSNRPADGPKNFPVGVQACNPGTNSVDFSDVEADFVWLSGGTTNDDTYIKLRSGSLDPIQPNPQIDLTPGSCYDFYFEVEITQNSGAFDQTRRYQVDISYDDPDLGSRQTVSTPTPRELYIEYLISQNRNSVIDVELDGVSVPVGGDMDLMVGETYDISLDASTATQGYEQIESFIHFPNTIFQVLAVNTTYSADSSAYVSNPNDRLYADSCLWENDPDNPNYRSCLDVGKNGGTVRVDYTVKIISGAGTSDTLNSLIYDFSGSSYHYNADYSISYRVFNIIGPSNITISKRFIPDSIAPGDSSTLTITLNNPTSSTVGGVNFSDTLPTGMVVDVSPNSSTTGCGGPTFSPSAGDPTLSFSNGTLAPNSSCTIKVDVTVPSDGSYTNETNHLFINTTVDTGNFATDTLDVGVVASCTPGQTMAVWTVPPTSTNPPDQSSPVAGSPTTIAANVPSAALSASDSTRAVIETSDGKNDSYSWDTWGYQTPVQNLDFVLDTRNYSEVVMIFYEQVDSNGPDTLTIYYDSGSGITSHPVTPTVSSTVEVFTEHTIDFTGLTNPSGVTTFRISGSGAKNDNSGADLFIDNISFTGCSENDPPPTISKAFGTDPVTVNGTSTLTFTINNTDASAVNLTGVTFTDELPSGLEVASVPNSSTNCPGTPTWSPGAGNTTLTFGNPTGATMAAASSCTVAVDITATAAGFFENISGYISSDQSGENKTSTGYATDTLTAIAPPNISKNFSDATILTGSTTSLSFTITNPNQSEALSGIAFSDTLPSGLDVANASSSICGGTLTVADNYPAADSIVLSGGSLAASSSCTFSVTITGNTSGAKDNLTGVVTSNEGGDGNSASSSIFVKDPTPDINILKQIGLTNNPDGIWAKSLSIIALPTDVYYKFIVENIGDVDLTSIRIFDPPGDYPTNSPVACTFYEPAVPPAAAVLFTEPLSTGDYIYCIVGPISVTNPGSNTNTAVAYGTYSGTDYPSDPSSASYGTLGLSLDKSAAESYFESVGDTLNYSYLVTNSGYVALEGPVTVADNKVTVICPALIIVGDKDNYLDPGETLECTASYTITGTDVSNGSVTNVASASVDGVTSPTDTEMVNYVSISIDKSLDGNADEDGSGDVSEDDTLTYRFVAANMGTGTLTGVSIADPLAGLSALSCTPVQPASLAANETLNCTATYVVTAADVTAGQINNEATASNDQTADVTDTLSVSVYSQSMSLVKSLDGNADEDGSGDVSEDDTLTYRFVAANMGTGTLTGVSIADPLAGLSALSCTPVQPASLAANETLNCTATYVVTAADVTAGQINNEATASNDQTADVTDTLEIPIVRIFDPPFGYKDYDDSGLPVLRWTMVWINDSNTSALDAEVYDPIPAGTSYVPLSLTCTAEGSSISTNCVYDSVNNQIIWEGTMGPDLGATNAANANNEIVISFQITIGAGITTVENEATIDADLNDDGDIDAADDEIAVANAQAVWVATNLPPLPNTGFAPGVFSSIPEQLLERDYQLLGEVWLEIPSLGVRTSIVGVPIVEDSWDVTWLSSQIGWLTGTAFPSYSGNSVLTSHVYLPSGMPGPFVNLNQLNWDDQIIIHAFGQQFIYQVRSNQVINADDKSALRHEESPWLTLLTCKGYNEDTDSYKYRVMVRAVLLEVKFDLYH